MSAPLGNLTWAALLGHWIDFARSAVALPDDTAGLAMRDSVADIIMLQAVHFALEHLAELDPQEKALGLDRAQIIITKHTNAIHARWIGLTFPDGLTELIDDANLQLKLASQCDSGLARP